MYEPDGPDGPATAANVTAATRATAAVTGAAATVVDAATVVVVLATVVVAATGVVEVNFATVVLVGTETAAADVTDPGVGLVDTAFVVPVADLAGATTETGTGDGGTVVVAESGTGAAVVDATTNDDGTGAAVSAAATATGIGPFKEGSTILARNSPAARSFTNPSTTTGFASQRFAFFANGQSGS